jgi:putative DNA primase/helicase
MLLSWLAPRPRQTNGEALAFVQALALEAMLPFTVLAAPARNGMEVATLNMRTDTPFAVAGLLRSTGEARGWIAKRASRRLYVLTAQTSGPLRGRAISESDLVQTRIVAVAVPAAQARAIDAFRPAPSIVAGTPRGFALAWRLRNPTAPAKARALAARIAAKLGGAPLDFLFPIPGVGGVRLLQHLKGSQHWALVTAFDESRGVDQNSETAASEPLFAPAESFQIEATDWLWPGVIACGDLTLLGGAPGMGKSQVAIYAAATVSRGGTWPDGSRAQRGSVILCETEDRPETALRPRLEAAGADLARVSFGKHMDLSTSMAALAAQAERLPDLRLLVLSPVLTFFGATSNDDNTVRAKLRPLLEWAAARNVAVLGIIHPLKTGAAEVFAGCDAYRRACRAAWRLAFDPADDEPIEKLKRRVLLAAKVNNAPDALRLTYRIEGVQLPGGIGTSRVVFETQGDAKGEAPAPSTAKRTMGAAAVRSWLAEQLGHGRRDGSGLKIAAAAAGISLPGLYRAADSLGVIREPIEGTSRKLWRLP